MNRHQNDTLERWKEVLTFLKSRFPLYHQSNFFFRDLQYGIQAMLEGQGKWISYRDAEKIAREFAAAMEKMNIFIPIDRQTWVVNYPEYRTPVTKSAPAPRPGPNPPPKQAASPVKPPPPGSPTGEQPGGH